MNLIDEIEVVISDIEAGQANEVSVRTLRRVCTALAENSTVIPAQSWDGRADTAITRAEAEEKWTELREALSPFLEYEDSASAEFIDDNENAVLDAILDTLFS